MPVLIQRHNDIVVNKFEIKPFGLSIGRSIKNDIYLDDPSTSQKHAEITSKELKDGSYIYFIVDLGSTNSTYVNQQTIQEHLLSDQDEINIGIHYFKYIDENAESLEATRQYKKSWIPGVLVLK
jgi:pSer/pThr/pTyr-binding forkhead associated (FHA) protein